MRLLKLKLKQDFNFNKASLRVWRNHVTSATDQRDPSVSRFLAGIVETKHINIQAKNSDYCDNDDVHSYECERGCSRNLNKLTDNEG